MDVGLHVPHIRSLTPLHTKSEVRRLAGESPRLEGVDTPRSNLRNHSRTMHKAQHLALSYSLLSYPSTLSRAILALTLSRHVLRLKDLTTRDFDGLFY